MTSPHHPSTSTETVVADSPPTFLETLEEHHSLEAKVHVPSTPVGGIDEEAPREDPCLPIMAAVGLQNTHRGGGSAGVSFGDLDQDPTPQ